MLSNRWLPGKKGGARCSRSIPRQFVQNIRLLGSGCPRIRYRAPSDVVPIRERFFSLATDPCAQNGAQTTSSPSPSTAVSQINSNIAHKAIPSHIVQNTPTDIPEFQTPLREPRIVSRMRAIAKNSICARRSTFDEANETHGKVPISSRIGANQMRPVTSCSLLVMNRCTLLSNGGRKPRRYLARILRLFQLLLFQHLREHVHVHSYTPFYIILRAARPRFTSHAARFASNPQRIHPSQSDAPQII